MSMPLWSQSYLKKVIRPEEIEAKACELRLLGNKIATLNGSFDLLHAGHLQIIYEAAQVADLLIVALNSDDSIRKYKCKSRPIIPLEYRLQMMAALEFVDYVTWFDETDPRELLKRISPNVHVNGEEYGQDCLEAATVKSLGGSLHIVAKVDGLSTSAIIKKITATA